MSSVSYSDVFKINLERDLEEEIRPGDRVRTGPNLYPFYDVLAVHGAKAWLRNVQTGQDGVTSLSRCRRIAD